MTTAADLDDATIQRLESELDPEMRFRPLLPVAGWIVAALLFGLSCFHYYTAGFGLLQETLHRGIHISCVLGLIFLVFSWSQKNNARQTAMCPRCLLRLPACREHLGRRYKSCTVRKLGQN